MRQTIKITTPDGKTVSKEVTTRNLEHFQMQLNNRVHVQENKKIYKRSRDKKVRGEF